jgi:hypothetical protein
LEHHRVVLSTIPIVLLCIMVRIALEVSPLQFSGIFSSETVTPFTTVSMFVIAIMLGGIMEDYKEAERLPADMVSALDSVSEKLAFCQLTTLRAKQVADKEKSEQQHRHHGGDGGGEPCCCCKRAKAGEEKEREEELAVFDSRAEHTELLAYVTCVLEYFACMRTDQDILAITSMYAKYFAMRVNESAEVTHTESWEIFEAFDDLRTSLLRMSVIKNTNFIPSGHRLMQVLVTATVILVTLARYDNGSPDVPGGGGGRRLWGAADSPDSSHEQWFIENVSAYCNVGTYVFLFIYVLFLIDDLEDPFECVGGGPLRAPRGRPRPLLLTPAPFFPIQVLCGRPPPLHQRAPAGRCRGQKAAPYSAAPKGRRGRGYVPLFGALRARGGAGAPPRGHPPGGRAGGHGLHVWHPLQLRTAHGGRRADRGAHRGAGPRRGGGPRRHQPAPGAPPPPLPGAS